MRLLVSVVLLLVQLGPIAGAGICLHGGAPAAQPDAECAMPMSGMPQDDDQSQSGASQDCDQLMVCAPAAPVVPQAPVQLFGISQPNHTDFSTPASLFPGDPIAPPQPPPIV